MARSDVTLQRCAALIYDHVSTIGKWQRFSKNTSPLKHWRPMKIFVCSTFSSRADQLHHASDVIWTYWCRRWKVPFTFTAKHFQLRLWSWNRLVCDLQFQNFIVCRLSKYFLFYFKDLNQVIVEFFLFSNLISAPVDSLLFSESSQAA